MIQNNGQRGHGRDVLHARRNHVITDIMIPRRIGRALGEIFICLLLKNTALLPGSVENTRFRWCSFRHHYRQFNQGHPFTTFSPGMGKQSPIFLGSPLGHTLSIPARTSNNN